MRLPRKERRDDTEQKDGSRASCLFHVFLRYPVIRGRRNKSKNESRRHGVTHMRLRGQ